VDEKEIKTISNHLGRSIENELITIGGNKSLNAENGCVFLKDKKCSIYDARPQQCKNYPFWSHIDLKKEMEFCPGLTE